MESWAGSCFRPSGVLVELPKLGGVLLNGAVGRELAGARDVAQALEAKGSAVRVVRDGAQLGLDVVRLVVDEEVVVRLVPGGALGQARVELAEHARSPVVEGAVDQRFDDGAQVIVLAQVGVGVVAVLHLVDLLDARAEDVVVLLPGLLTISILAPSYVPSVTAPLSMSFMLLVPLASVPAVEICSLMSAAGEQLFRITYVVVLHEQHLHLALVSGSWLTSLGHLIDKFDDGFGPEITGGTLGAEQEEQWAGSPAILPSFRP